MPNNERPIAVIVDRHPDGEWYEMQATIEADPAMFAAAMRFIDAIEVRAGIWRIRLVPIE